VSDEETPGEQLRLALDRAPSYRREDFVISGGNAAAVAAVDAWPAWPGGRLALIGPEGSGKTHLARAWAARSGAAILGDGEVDVSTLRGRPLLVEDADRRPADETLFHLINMADGGASLLITGRAEPGQWPTKVPDLRSRLNGLPVARIEPPDDVVLAGVMEIFFLERNIRPADDLIPYLINRAERSIPAIRDMVRRLDEVAGAQKREINRALARQILAGDKDVPDLFD
jgi:chromosomal replication initiation ATPase DnaA